MKLTSNFTLEELIHSNTAKNRGIDNTPNQQALDNLTRLAKEVLQPIRTEWGKPLIVSSGYRSYRLNQAVRGAANSDHRYGAAADIHTLTNYASDNNKLFDLITKMASEGKIHCRQIIDEYGYQWVHVSINHPKNLERHNQILHLK